MARVMDDPLRESPVQLITMTEAAARAANSAAWWRKLAARGEIPVVKLGRSSRLREADVNRIISEGVQTRRPVGP